MPSSIEPLQQFGFSQGSQDGPATIDGMKCGVINNVIKSFFIKLFIKLFTNEKIVYYF